MNALLLTLALAGQNFTGSTVGWGDTVYGPNGCFAIGADSRTHEAVVAVLHDNSDVNQRVIGSEVRRLSPVTGVVSGRTVRYAPVNEAAALANAMAGNSPSPASQQTATRSRSRFAHAARAACRGFFWSIVF